MKSARYVLAVLMGFGLVACDRSVSATNDKPTSAPAAATTTQASSDVYANVARTDKVVKTDAEWRKQLTPEQFHVLREKGTERAFTGATHDNHDKGTYACAGCDLELFSSDTKFESGTGWPSFWQPLANDRVHVAADNSHGMT